MNKEFYDFYNQLLGARWEVLLQALRASTRKHSLISPFVEIKNIEPYELDYASVLAAEALTIMPNYNILDMCAAPGGKSLVLINKLEGQGHFVLNDLSLARVSRLKRVVREYVPASLQKQVKISNKDGSFFGLKQKNIYDAVLLDAPCSGERHLLENSTELKNWSAKRSKKLAQRQWSLLCSALDAVKGGGEILYSTCSISPYENDLLVKRLFERREGRFKILNRPAKIGEATDYGWQVWPDKCEGLGPIYYSVIQKID